MTLHSQPLPGVSLLEPFAQEDRRGSFVKPFHEGQLAEFGIAMRIREEFFSKSARGVLRGMHFQVPPHAHQKLVYCIKGKVLDVVLDLRRSSPRFGRWASFELSEENRYVVHIPVGFAHGFLSLSDGSCLVYKTDSVHAPDSDRGVRWDSFGFEWPGLASPPSLSDRDANHPPLRSFESPFD